MIKKERERERERDEGNCFFGVCSHHLSLLYHHFLGRDETDVVVKVFAKHDPSLKLEAHEKKLYGEPAIIVANDPYDIYHEWMCVCVCVVACEQRVPTELPIVVNLPMIYM